MGVLSDRGSLAAITAARALQAEEGWQADANEFLLWLVRFVDGTDGHVGLIESVLGPIPVSGIPGAVH